MNKILKICSIENIFDLYYIQKVYMDNSKDKNSFKPSGGLKFMVILLFFILGLLFSLPPTMILVYAELPSDYIISFFIASTIPTSFQFVFAPFIEKYTSISYGKKKTWVMATLAVNFVLIFTGSFFTSQNQQVTLGVLFTIVMVFHAIYSLSINALAVKELRIPDKTALMQGVGQISGFFSGSMGLQKLTSKEFAEFIGLSHPITTPAIFFRIVCAIMIFTAISLHFRFKERVLESEKTVQNISILKVLSYYKQFFRIKTKYCRAFIMLLFWIQGFVLYEAYYEFQLIKNHGFSRDTYNTIVSGAFLPVILVSILLTPYVKRFGWLRFCMSYMIGRWVTLLFVLIFFPTSVVGVAIVYFLMDVLDTFRFLLRLVLVASFPVMGLSAMFITMLNCAQTIGKFNSPHILLTSAWGGWKTSAIVGLCIQAVIIVLFPRYFKFMEKGTVELEGMVETQENYIEKESLNQTLLDEENQEQVQNETKKDSPLNYEKIN